MTPADGATEQETRVRVRDEAGRCVGEAPWDVTTPTTLTVWLDDSETPEKDGASLGEVLSVSVLTTDETKVSPVIADVFGVPSGAVPDRVVFYPDAVYVVSGLARALGDSGGTPVGPLAFGLSRPFPNPASDAVSVSYVLEEAADVHLEVYDVLGRLVLSVDRGHEERGAHAGRLSLRALPAGVYAVHLVASGALSARQATVQVTVAR